MKITRIETIRVALPFETGGEHQGMRPGLAPWRSMESLMVRVECEDGSSGWGESFGHLVNPGVDAILQTLVAPWFLGQDSTAIVSITDRAERNFHGLGRNGPVLYALAGIDLALWDLAGQRAGQPLYRLLGGTPGPIERYASLMRYGGDEAVIAKRVATAYDAGYRTIKLHERTVPAFRAARDAVAREASIVLDVNCPWSVAQARAVAREIGADGFGWLEEPVWPPEDFQGLAQVRAEGVPIAAGENIATLHEFKRAFEAGALDVVQPSVIKVGGITPMRRILALADALSVRVVPHAFYWGPGYLATAHLVAAMPYPTLLETAYIDFARQPHPLFDPARSTLTLPDTPGLGFEPDWSALEPHVLSRTTIGP